MKIAVLGTGMVGKAIANKLVALGHDVRMGARSGDNPAATEWAKGAGSHASHGTFADAAAFGEIVFNATAGMGSLDAVRAAGKENLAKKVLVDVANPLDFSKGMPPSLSVTNTDSLGEQIQRELPDTHVVKALNTLNCDLMVDPSKLPGKHDLFICGNDAGAKGRVVEILRGWFDWKTIHDLGDITGARATEAYVLFWVRLYGTMGTPNFNVHVVKA